MSRFRFTLYVAGDSPRSRLASANLRRIGDEQLGGDYDFDVVDVIADPGRAETDRILTTPTLIREHPSPARRVTGDLTDSRRVINALALQDDEP